jgi:hypothetical protein
VRAWEVERRAQRVEVLGDLRLKTAFSGDNLK